MPVTEDIFKSYFDTLSKENIPSKVVEDLQTAMIEITEDELARIIKRGCSDDSKDKKHID